MSEFLRLLWGTVIYRPYVYGFFACFLFFALKHLRLRGTLIYLPLAFTIAFLSEYNSTNRYFWGSGFPFGVYTYIDTTRTRELWLANIPFWDSLSFVFLSYFSWIVASLTLAPRDPRSKLKSWQTALLAGFLMMLLDVIIDPLTLQGDKWFLGRIYFYPNGGAYFGVTLTNFIGWWFVGSITVFIAQRLGIGEGAGPPHAFGCFGVYAGVFGFNLAMTYLIDDMKLLACSFVVTFLTLGVIGTRCFLAFARKIHSSRS